MISQLAFGETPGIITDAGPGYLVSIPILFLLNNHLSDYKKVIPRNLHFLDEGSTLLFLTAV